MEERLAIGANVVYETIRREGEEELRRAVSALAWSGLAAGLSMGFSFIAEGLLVAHLPDSPWRPLLSKAGYCIGFLIVILGRQQLFTENTLTVILPLLLHKDMKTLLARTASLGNRAERQSGGDVPVRPLSRTDRRSLMLTPKPRSQPSEPSILVLASGPSRYGPSLPDG